MSYTPEQLATVLEGAHRLTGDSKSKSPIIQSHQALTVIAREQEAYIRSLEVILADKRERITALEAKADLACASLVSAEKEIESLEKLWKTAVEQKHEAQATAVAAIERKESGHREVVRDLRAEIANYREHYVTALSYRTMEKLATKMSHEIEQLRASLKRIGDQAEESGDPANPAFFDLVNLIVDEIDKHKENPT